MNKTQITLIITGFILLALMATNPSIEDHREGVKKMYKEKLESINKEEKNDLAIKMGTGIASLIGDGFINKIVSRKNFLLFSVTNISMGDKSMNIGLGVFGQVFLQDYDKLKNTFSEKSINSDSYYKDRMSYQLSLIPEYKSENEYWWIEPNEIGKDFNSFIYKIKKDSANYKVEIDTVVYADNSKEIYKLYSKESAFQKFEVSFREDGSLRILSFIIKEDPSIIIQFYKSSGFKIYEEEKDGAYLSNYALNYCLYVSKDNVKETTVSFITISCEDVEHLKPNWFEKLIKIITNWKV